MTVTIYIVLNKSSRIQLITLDITQASRMILNSGFSLVTKDVELDYVSEWNWREEAPDWNPEEESWDSYRAGGMRSNIL